MFEVEPPQKGVTPLRIRSSSGRMVNISQVKHEEGKTTFLDTEGRTVEPRILSANPKRALLLTERQPVARARRFDINHIPIFLDTSGNVIDVEQGQADGNVLIAQNGSPIYYGISVNEVFAYFRTMQGASVTPTLFFPTTQTELNGIIAFASGHGKTFVDPEALAIEVKTSWIEAAGIPNANEYITTTATIPTYDKTDPNKWIPNGQKTVTLAMVGMHVVGSTKGHPEMIWATFEHVGITPNDDYSYRNSVGGVTAVPRNTAGTWVFCPNNSTGPFDQPRNALDGSGNIVPVSASPVGPDTVIRRKAWGAASDVSPNFRGPAASNSEIISVNNTVRAVLIPGDVRRNYIMTGSTWMIAGSFPFTTFSFTQVGTSKMNNTTMETFMQGTDNRAAGTFNCFGCHPGNNVGVSHVFTDLKPLF